jgi:DNA-binding transcriptional ArsR family regulator
MTQQSFKFVADEKWLVLLRASLRNKIIKEIGASAFSIYIIIRSEADIFTGGAVLSYKAISGLTGFSASTISVALAKLKKAGLIDVEDLGGANIKRYYCKDIIPFAKVGEGENPFIVRQELEDGKRAPDGAASFLYVPNEMLENQKKIHNFLRTGEKPETKVHIEHFHLHLNINATEAAAMKIEDVELRELLLRMAKAYTGGKSARAEGITINGKKVEDSSDEG